MMKDILTRTGTSIFGLSEGIAMAVPISAEMLGTALFAVIAGHLVELQGWKRPFIYGTIFMSAGAFIAYYMNNPYMFILARFLVGAAYGLALVTLQCYPMISPNIETRNSGLASQNSGLNAGYCCGVAIGGLSADYLGYSTVYIFSVIIALCAIPYARYLMSSSHTSSTGVQEKVGTLDVVKFFTNRNVFLFFTAAFIPVSICGMFLTYMFPVFAQEKGISAGDIGRVFMLNSLVIIYIGPALVNFLTKRKSIRGKYTMALYMLVTLTGLLVFGIKPTVITAIIIILFVGLGDSFGLPMSNDYLISLKAAARIGYDKSVGYLNFVGNIGQMIGPVLMGYLFTMGYQKGTYYILAGMAAAMLIFFTFSRNEVATDE
jgi:predicted MFS family arabinose efflux permease